MLQPPPLPRTLEAALRDLRDPSPAVRASAVVDLPRYLDTDRFLVIAALRQALEDPHPTPRATAATALGEHRVEECVDDLVRLVEDPDTLPGQMALDALGEIGTEGALRRLRAALRDERPELRFQAVMALPKRLDDHEADCVLSTGIQDEDEQVRYIALRTAEERWCTPGRAPRVQRAARAALADRVDAVKVAAALLLASWRDSEGAGVLLKVLEGQVRPSELQDEIAAVEAAGALGLQEAIPALERRAFGAARFFRERCSFHARISLARLGHRRAREEILSGLRAWTRLKRDEAVVAVGKARLLEARSALESLRERPGRVDPVLLREALEALDEER
ncbi:MAG: HEAT repeat domain-containing protein [Myxococcales bacterium]|nr:HEAT repeat domain-containing protein [Polyangiaceae bacterium]MDW8247689.1 HEAT repeat domain-containing protein [Myxococcales bacterium]